MRDEEKEMVANRRKNCITLGRGNFFFLGRRGEDYWNNNSKEHVIPVKKRVKFSMK